VLAAMLALLTGSVLIFLSGFARLGFLADFVSLPVPLGFINGVAVIIISQLPQLLGIKLEADSTLGTLRRVLTHIGDAQ
jgi:sulfate permease, SulP family